MNYVLNREIDPSVVRHRIGALALAAVTLVVAGHCNQSESNNDAETLALVALASAPVSMPFSLVADNQSVGCNQNFTIGTGNDTVQIKDFRVYLSEFAWITPDGEVSVTLPDLGDWQKNNAVLIDLEDGTGYCSGTGTTATNGQITLPAPPSNATGLAFSIGLPDSVNRLNNTTTSAPFNISQMYWTWANGYKNANVELSQNGTTAYRFHLGSIGCTGTPGEAYTSCSRPMKGRVQLNNVNVANGIQFDVKDWFSGQAYAVTDCVGAPTPDARCQALRNRMGLDQTSGQPSTGNAIGFELKQ